MRNVSLAAALLWTFFVYGCAPESTSETREEDTASVAQPEPWSEEDDPSTFSYNLERRASALPTSGEADPVPWAGNYWPMWQDSINFRWAGPRTMSPAKKYERAFSVSGVEEAVSRSFGVESQRQAKECDTQDECESGEACAKRRNTRKGRCIPTWFGMCHGWAVASVLFPEPKHEVSLNGVTFKVQDIKALISLVHNNVVAKYLSGRCNDSEARGTVEYDEYGRPSSPACRDTNAGTFHIIVTNYLGIHKHTLVEDRTFDEHVWNHPIRGYKIVDQRPVTAEEADRLIIADDAPPPSGYLFNPEAASFLRVRMEVATITGTHPSTDGNLSHRIDDFTEQVRLEYVLELDGEGRIIGGEWAGNSKRNHPDFLWLPVSAGTRSVASGKITYANVRKLVMQSLAPAGNAGAPPAPTAGP